MQGVVAPRPGILSRFLVGTVVSPVSIRCASHGRCLCVPLAQPVAESSPQPMVIHRGAVKTCLFRDRNGHGLEKLQLRPSR